MEQTYGDDFGFKAAQPGGKLRHGCVIDGFQHLPAGIESLVQAEYKPALNDWATRRNKEIVEFGSGLSANLDDVLETRGRNESHTGAFALQHGVRRDGRAVYDFCYHALGRKMADSLQHSSRRVLWRRRALEQEQPLVSQTNEVGKRP